MKTVVNSKEITIDELVDKLQRGEKLIVYYRSRNEPAGVPVFLCKDDNEVYFRSCIALYGSSYKSSSFRETLLSASKGRKLYVLDKEEASELFKLQQNA
jgi:hypothetical protein